MYTNKLSDPSAVHIYDYLDTQNPRRAIHSSVSKTDRPPVSGNALHQIAAEETAIRIDDPGFRLSTAATPQAEILHLQLLFDG